MKWKINNFYLIMTVENIAVQMFAQLTYLLLLFLGYSFSEIGVYLAVFTATTMVSEIPSGILVDSIGEKTVLKIAFMLRAIGLFGMTQAHNFFLLLLTAVATGIASSLGSGTLESWIVNEIKETNTQYDIGKLFANINVIGTFFGLVAGFLGAQIIGRDNPTIPFYVSSILFILLFVYITMTKNLFATKLPRVQLSEIRKRYKATISDLVRVLGNWRVGISVILLSVPEIVDIGPSNQWQVMMSETMDEYMIGYYVVAIGLVTIISNLALTYFRGKFDVGILKLIDYTLMLDAVVVLWLCIVNSLFPYLFLVHVFFVGVEGTLVITYLHEKLILNNSLRTSIVSAFYSLQALWPTVLLPINGILSEQIGISSTWIIFTILSMVVFWVLRVVGKKMVKDN